MASSYRDFKRQARTQLHEHMSDPVWFISGQGAQPVATSVRLHLTFDRIGELLRSGFSERMETTPKMVFLRPAEIPNRNAFVITKDMGAYRINHSYPPDDITVTCEVIELTDSQILSAGFDPTANWCGLPPAVISQ